LIDLRSNENPYKTLYKVTNSVCKDMNNMNRYLSAKELDILKEKTSEYCGVEKNRIVFGPGTDFLIERVLIKNFQNKNLYVLNPCFYKSVGTALDLGMGLRRIQIVPPDFHILWDNLHIEKNIVLIDSPNNPTGKYLVEANQIQKLLEKDNIVIVDEAGYEFGEKTMIDLVDKYKNLMIVRSLDKSFALAGLKVGYCICGDELLKAFGNNISINRASWSASLETLNHSEYSDECVSKIKEERKYLMDELKELDFKVYESNANYILIESDIPQLALELKDRGILIEDLSYSWLKNHYRVSIGKREDNKALINELHIIKKEEA